MNSADSSDPSGLEEIIAEYLAAVEAGQPPSQAELIAKYPAHADELREFFADKQQIDQLVRDDKQKTPAAGLTPTLPQKPAIDSEAASPPATSESLMGKSIRYLGDYELLAEIGRGGMGVVYKAHQVSLSRIVALKMVLAGQLASDNDIKRFHAEAEAVANLDHRGIVPIYEVGHYEGQHYFSMGFVSGKSLADTVLPPRHAAELVKKIAEAVAYAHDHGVIHRDLKPGNVLIDDNGQPRVTDFGLAKRLASDSELTATGQVLGTPSYMPPEQALGKLDEIGPESDVYSLGAILYYLLTGRPPFQTDSVANTLRQVIDSEPVPPRQLNPLIPRDLDTICLKAMSKERSRRYQTALSLRDDLQRWLEGRVITARRASRKEIIWRWCRRNPIGASLIGVSAVAVLAVGGFLTGLVYQGKLQTSLENEFHARQEAERFKYYDHIARAYAESRDGNIRSTKRLLEDSPEGQRNWEWRYLTRHCHENVRSIEGWNVVVLSPDGTVLARSDVTQEKLVICDTITGAEQHRIDLHCRLQTMMFSPDGGRIASNGIDSDGGDGEIQIWDVGTGKQLLNFKAHTLVIDLAFSPDGAKIASAGIDGTTGKIRIWNSTSGEQLHEFKSTSNRSNAEMNGVRFSPCGRWLYAVGAYDGIRVWDATSGKEIRLFPEKPILTLFVALSPDGSKLATSGEQVILIWDVASRKLVQELEGHVGVVTGFAFSPDGTRLASCGVDRTVRVWDVANGAPVVVHKGHEQGVFGVAFSPDGLCLMSAGDDGRVRTWDSDSSVDTQIESVSDCIAFTHDGQYLASAGVDGAVHFWETPGRQAKFEESRPRNEHRRRFDRLMGQNDTGAELIACSSSGQRLAALHDDGEIEVWSTLDSGDDDRVQTPLSSFKSLPPHLAWSCLAISNDGKQVASACEVGQDPHGERSARPRQTVQLWNAATGQKGHTFSGSWRLLTDVAFSGDGLRLAAVGWGGEVRLWNVETGELIHELKTPSLSAAFDSKNCLAISPSGDLVVTGSRNGQIRLWDSATGQLLYLFEGHTYEVFDVAFSPDGSRLASAGRDNVIKIWDVENRLEVLTLKDHTDSVESVQFSPDGDLLASSSRDGTIRIWDARPWTSDLAVENEAAGIVRALFGKPLRKEDVVTYLSTTRLLPSTVRDMALDLVNNHGEETDPQLYFDACWKILRQRYLNSFQYQFALNQAEAACQLGASAPQYLTALGLAHYRLGKFQEALDVLNQIEQGPEAEAEKSYPIKLAVTAMAEFRLGREEQAKSTLARLRNITSKPEWEQDDDALKLVQEAEEVIEAKFAEEPR